MALKLLDGKPYARFNVLVVEADALPTEGDAVPEATTRITYKGNKDRFVGNTEVFAHVRPKWYEEFNIYLDNLAEPIKFYVRDVKHDKKLGRIVIDPSSLKPKNRYDEWHTLEVSSSERTSSGYAAVPTSAARLHLVYSLAPLSILPGGYEKLSGKEAAFRMVLRTGDVVCSGDFIEGDIIFMTPRPYSLEKTFIRIYGTEKVEWNEKDELGRSERFRGVSTVINKWYHGWKNDTGKDINAGYYNWHFRVRVPEGLPPAFKDSMGEISYLLHAYLDHDRYTRGIPLQVRQPIPKSVCPEAHVTKHNINIHGILDQPLYYLEDNPIHLRLDLTVKDLSEYNVRHIKVTVVETSTYAGDTNVAVVKRVLHKSTVAKGSFSLLHYEDNGAVSPHRTFQKTVLIDLPAGYNKPSLGKSVGAQRILVEHKVQVKVVKDTLTSPRIIMDIPFILTTKETKLETKRQVISLVSATNVQTPPTPVQKRKARTRPPRQPAEGDEPYVYALPKLKAFASDPDLSDQLPPPNPVSQDISMLPFSNVFNPFLDSPQPPPAPAFVGPVPTWNPFPTESPEPMSPTAHPLGASLDPIPSTFTSTKSFSLYSADSPDSGAANPYVTANYQHPFASTATNDIANASPGDLTMQSSVETKLPPGKKKGYDVI